MKKFYCLLMIVLIAFFPVIPAIADEEENVTVYVDEELVLFDVPPQLIGGRTMVPLRAIFEKLGATVEWDDATQTVTAYNEAKIVKATIDSNVMTVNGTAKTMDVPPMLLNGRTLVPARFVAEAFDCDVNWDENTWSVYITTYPIDYSQVEQNSAGNAINANATLGTLNNPYSASSGATVTYQEYSFNPLRNIQVTCNEIIRGAKANSLISNENRYNDKPTSNQEWIILTFNLKFVSSSNGSNDKLDASDVIYKNTFYTSAGASIPVYDMATLGDLYGAYGIFDVDLYPGASSKVVIGLLTDKNIGDILLSVPNGDRATWISCTPPSNTSQLEPTDSNVTATTGKVDYYWDAEIPFPTYDSVTGAKFLEQISDIDSNIKKYEQTTTDSTDYYIKLLLQEGWEKYDTEYDDKTLSITTYFVKNGDIIVLSEEFGFREIWVLYYRK